MSDTTRLNTLVANQDATISAALWTFLFDLAVNGSIRAGVIRSSSSLEMLDSDSSHFLGLLTTENLSDDKNITLIVNGGDRVINLGGNLILATSTTISTFGASLVDDVDAAAARVTIGALAASDIDTLAELNAIIADATLIPTTDPRLSDARTPTGPAGGDLSGNYPNPTVSVSGAPGMFYAESEGESTTTSTDFSEQKLRLSFTATNDDYDVKWSIEEKIGAASQRTDIRLELDDTTTINENNGNGNTLYMVRSGFKRVTLTAGTRTFDLDFRSSSGTQTASVQRARISATKVVAG